MALTGRDFCDEKAHTLPDVTIENVRQYVAGLEALAPLYGGGSRPYVNLDNAATTPPLTTVLGCVKGFVDWYGSVHRGAGFKSLLSTKTYEKCRRLIAGFVGANQPGRELFFAPNATYALNKLAYYFKGDKRDRIITTSMEHHSNMLPWRRTGCEVRYVRTTEAEGALDLDALEREIREAAGSLRLVTVTGASNVTGYCPPLRRIARLCHEAGGLFAVDVSQLLPHRPFSMGALEDPERVDFVAFSAHKIYAPFGSGVLIGPRDFFTRFKDTPPDLVGGGVVEAVTLDDVVWAALPDREEPGTPNLLGVAALASAVRTLEKIGMEAVAAHEQQLTRRLLEGLSRIEGLTLYGSADPGRVAERVGVVSFNLKGFHHALLAAVLSHEWGIGVRHGCFCAHPYIRELIGLSEEEMRSLFHRRQKGEQLFLPGMVRVSLGLYNTVEEVDLLCEALRSIQQKGPKALYQPSEDLQDYEPERPFLVPENITPL